jgi:YwiC-like protein
MVMLPREHGAYSQMVLPLATSFLVCGVTLAAALTGVAVLLGFLAHEPLMVLLGRRGMRVRGEVARRARTTLTIIGAAMIAVGGAAILLAPVQARAWFALPLIPATIVAVGVMRKQEKSGPVEIAVALAFSLAAAPIALTAGAPVATAISIAVAFAVVFVAGVLAVRVAILKVRAGGNPRAVRQTRAALATLAAIALAGLGASVARAILPWAPLAAVVPGIVVAAMFAFRTTAPRLKTVGWTLMSASTAAALMLIAGL